MFASLVSQRSNSCSSRIQEYVWHLLLRNVKVFIQRHLLGTRAWIVAYGMEFIVMRQEAKWLNLTSNAANFKASCLPTVASSNFILSKGSIYLLMISLTHTFHLISVGYLALRILIYRIQCSQVKYLLKFPIFLNYILFVSIVTWVVWHLDHTLDSFLRTRLN